MLLHARSLFDTTRLAGTTLLLTLLAGQAEAQDGAGAWTKPLKVGATLSLDGEGSRPEAKLTPKQLKRLNAAVNVLRGTKKRPTEKQIAVEAKAATAMAKVILEEPLLNKGEMAINSLIDFIRNKLQSSAYIEYRKGLLNVLLPKKVKQWHTPALIDKFIASELRDITAKFRDSALELLKSGGAPVPQLPAEGS